MKILIVGDVHLGKGISIGKYSGPGSLNSRNVDKAKLLEWVLTKAEEYSVDRIIFTGDIFDNTDPEFPLLMIFLNFLKKANAKSIKIDIVYGNHEIKRIGNKYSSVLDMINHCNYENVTLYNEINSIKVDELTIVYVPFRDRKSFGVESNEEALKLLTNQINLHVGTNKILIGHLTIDGSLYVGDEIDDQANELMCPVDMFKDFTRVWMGHIHKPQDMSDNVSIVGSLDVSDYGEVDHEKICIFYDTVKDKTVKLFVPTRPLRSLEIVVPPGVDANKFIKDTILAEDKIKTLNDCILKLEIRGAEGEVDRKAIETVIFSLGVFHLPHFILHKVSSVLPIERKTMMNGSTIPTSAVKIFAENNKRFVDDKFKTEFIKKSLEIIRATY